ncbi:TlpA disulfide reductase family protein [Erythrobacter sp. A6_0]|uniref:TlpA family protein disulfide reductase n=1 Tax=Erythrobacter sp. A6_0 TaxID=2821089 RepID=UPI001FD72722|nr:TlpA disulfide reductase family protein [Erythrobacter sp. A6_0]
MSAFSRSSSLTLALVLLAGLGGCDRDSAEPAQETPATTSAAPSGEIDRSQAGQLMPAVNLTHPDGRTLNLGALQGQPVLLNLWATWCAPCVKEMPLLDDLASDYDGDLRVLVASQDLQGAEVVEPFFAERNFAYLEPWLDTETALSFALSGNLPTTVLYDANGREIWRVTGDLDWADPEVRAAIDDAISGANGGEN